MDMHPVDFVVLSLATWRLTSLVVKEDGPWDFLARLRHGVGVRYNENSTAFGLNVVGAAVACMWCASVWVGAAVCILYLLSRTTTLILCLPLALSAAALIVERMARHE